jgi:hypothetical protein
MIPDFSVDRSFSLAEGVIVELNSALGRNEGFLWGELKLHPKRLYYIYYIGLP